MLFANTWQGRRRFVFDLSPHNWRDSDFLPDLDIYEGPLIKAVRDNSERVHSGRYAVV
jgi:hypothetical protein